MISFVFLLTIFNLQYNVVRCYFPRFACNDPRLYPVAAWTMKAVPGCTVNIDVLSDANSIIARAGYEQETHQTITDDGYILTIFRILPTTDGAQPIILMHGMNSGATRYIMNGNVSLAFMLHDHGYDVWLPNLRGGEYSKGHMNLTSDEFEYWDYNMDVMLDHDVRRIIHYVVSQTKQQVFYSGYSMGGTLGAMYISKYVDESQKLLKGVILMAPSIYSKVAQGILYSILIHIGKSLWESMNSRFKAFFMNFSVSYIKYISVIFCAFCSRICMDYRIGNDEYTVSEDLLTYMSLQEIPHPHLVFHYAQLAEGLEAYDYGASRNIIKYGQAKPPVYDLRKARVPVCYFYGNRDTLAGDIIRAYQETGSEQKQIIRIPPNVKRGFRHVNFITSKNISTLFHVHYLAALEQFK